MARSRKPVDELVGTIMDVRIDERPRRDPLISLLITERDGTGQNDAWYTVLPALGVRLLALAEKDPLKGSERTFRLDPQWTIVQVLPAPPKK